MFEFVKRKWILFKLRCLRRSFQYNLKWYDNRKLYYWAFLQRGYGRKDILAEIDRCDKLIARHS